MRQQSGPTSDLAASFEEAWARFQARDSLRSADDDWEWSRGRAQYLTFLVRVEDAVAREHLARAADRLAGLPGVQTYPDWHWHVTVKGAGFQVIKRAHDDDVLRQDVPGMARRAAELLARVPAYQARLGLANAFAGAAFLEVWDGGRTREINALLLEGAPGIARYPVDGHAFLPHVTITRFTSSDGLPEIKEALSALRGEGPGPPFAVRRVELVKVWLSEEVPELDTLATYPLAAGPAPGAP